MYKEEGDNRKEILTPRDILQIIKLLERRQIQFGVTSLVSYAVAELFAAVSMSYGTEPHTIAAGTIAILFAASMKGLQAINAERTINKAKKHLAYENKDHVSAFQKTSENVLQDEFMNHNILRDEGIKPVDRFYNGLGLSIIGKGLFAIGAGYAMVGEQVADKLVSTHAIVETGIVSIILIALIEQDAVIFNRDKTKIDQMLIEAPPGV